MVNPNQVTGRVYINFNSVRLASKEGAKLNMGGVVYTPVIGTSGVDGYSEKIEAPFIECTISHKADTDLSALKNVGITSATFETDTGRHYTIAQARLINVLELTKGEVALRISGVSCEQV